MVIIEGLGLKKEVQDNIVFECSKLGHYDFCQIGRVVAVMKRSDSFLGKPEHMVNHDNDAIYVVFEPSKLAKVCGLRLDVISRKDSNIKFIPVETLVYRLFEFNFLYTQMVLNTDTWLGITPECVELFEKYAESCKEDINSKLKFKKESTIAYCVWQDILVGKFKVADTIFDRLYLVIYLLGRLHKEYRDRLNELYYSCYDNREISEELISLVNELNGKSLNIVSTFRLKSIQVDPRIDVCLKTYKLLTGEKGMDIRLC